MLRAARRSTFRTAPSTARTLARTLPAIALLGACAARPTVDTGLNKDLALAEQLQQRTAPALSVAHDTTAAPARDTVAPSAVTAHVAAPAPRVARASRTNEAARAPEHVAAASAAAPAAPQASAHPDTQTGTYTAGEAAAGEVAAGPNAGEPPAVAGQPAPSTYGTFGREPDARAARPHAVRDGVLASVAGAIIGAAASPHDRVRGGVIGAVTGGALGAVYGASADRSYAGYQPPSYRTYSGAARFPSYQRY